MPGADRTARIKWETTAGSGPENRYGSGRGYAMAIAKVLHIGLDIEVTKVDSGIRGRMMP